MAGSICLNQAGDGYTWGQAVTVQLPNPDSAVYQTRIGNAKVVAAQQLDDGSWVCVSGYLQTL